MPSNRLYGLDLSHHNPTLDYARAAREGVAFIIHKATEGASGYAFENAFHDRMPAIAASGAVPGGYHFLRSGDGAAQARYFHSVVRAWLDHPLGFLVQLDHEGADYDPTPPLSTAYAFADEWGRLTGGHPITHYFPRWFWGNLGSPGLTRHIGPLWASPYITGSGAFGQLATRVPNSAWNGYAGWPRPTLVQYSDAGTAAGVPGLDCNLFDGDQAALAALAGARPEGDHMPFHCQNLRLPPRFAFDADQKLIDRTATVILGTPLGGLTGLTRGWLSLSADFSHDAGNGELVQSTVRVAVASRTPAGEARWSVELIHLDSTTARKALPLPGNTDKLSVGRLDNTEGAGVDIPIGITLEMD
jgi:hypothetical protein